MLAVQEGLPIVWMLEGAGARAGYEDREYEDVGVRVIAHSEVQNLHGLDVLHALKEPTEYESEVPGPFLRIGARRVGLPGLGGSA